MRTAFVAILAFCVLPSLVHAAQEAAIPAKGQLAPTKGVDLGIADDETFRRPNSWGNLQEDKKTKFAARERLLATERVLRGDLSGPASRPGMSIAWRNAAQVEEVEVRVRNLGDTAGQGRVWVDVLDEEGGRLLRLEPPDELKIIRVPAFPDGGREGKIIRMKSSRELNNIIDQFDGDRRRYDVRATVETVGATDANPLDNVKAKSWNVPHRVQPGYANVFNYVFKNTEATPIRVSWLLERTPYPDGWRLTGVPASDTVFTLAPGERLQGTLMMAAPATIAEGAFLEARLSLVNADTRTIWQQKEWFQVYDTVPPTVTDYRLVATNDHRIGIQVLVSDEGSGVLEATGVSTQFSTDGGLTWARLAHNYKSGNFVVPTLFEGVLGPFAPGTDLQLRFTAKDTAGNSISIIPESAVAVVAPKGAEKLLDLATVYPRTQPNAIYALNPGTVDLGHIGSQFSIAIANASSETERVEGVASALKDVPITEETKKTLLDAAARLSTDSSRVVAAQRFKEIITDLPTTTTRTEQVNELRLERIVAPGAALLKISTIGLKVQ